MLYQPYWYEKETLPKHFTSKELCANVTASVKPFIDNLGPFKSDVRSYEKIIYGKTIPNTDFRGSSTNKNSIDDMEYMRNLRNSPYLTFNLIRSCVETIVNKIGSITPKITFTPKNAPRQMQEISKKLENWSMRLFKRGNVWSEGAKTFESACVSGVGVLKISFIPKNEKKWYSIFNLFKKNQDCLEYWNVPILDFFCDNAHYGANLPTMAGEVKSFYLYDLLRNYPQHKNTLVLEHGHDIQASVMVYEVFKEHKRHVICTDKVLLLDEEWNQDLPYVFFNWNKTPHGVLGAGLAKSLAPTQRAITYILSKTLSAIENVSTPTLYVDLKTKNAIKQSETSTGRIVGVDMGSSDQKPLFQYTTPQPINEQVLGILNILWQRGFEQIGVNQLASSGSIPQELAGASGIAIRSYEAIQSNRFQKIREEYEKFYVNILKKSLDLSTKSMYPKGVSRSEIMELLEYANAFPTSLLPDTPAGRLATVTDWINALPTVLTPDKALALIDSPDTNKFVNSETSRMMATQIVIEKALKKGEKPIVYIHLGLETYLEEARKIYALLLKEDLDERALKKVQLMDALIIEVQSMIESRDKATGVIQENPPIDPNPQVGPQQMATTGVAS